MTDLLKPPEDRSSPLFSSGEEKPAISVDWALYASCLEDPDVCEDDKRAFVESLFSIVLCFVDLGFKLHPLQQGSAREAISSADASAACGQGAELRQFIAGEVLESAVLPEEDAHDR